MHPKTNKFPSCVLANTGWGRMALRWFCRVWGGGFDVTDVNDVRVKVFWPWYLNIVKNALGLFAQGENVFRGTTCIQSLALHFVSTDILCSCNVELTLKPTWHVRSGLVDQTGYTVWFTARGLLPQFVHESSHRPLSLCAFRGCVLLPVMAFGWYSDIHCPNRVDKCFLGLHYTFIERKLSTGFWIIAIKFMFLNEFWLRYWERSEQ